MSRIRAAAVTALGALLLAGVGAATAHADDTGSVSDAGSGNIIGSVHGNVVDTQQTATGSGVGNQHNTLAVTGNTGSVSGTQNNGGNPDASQANSGNARGGGATRDTGNARGDR
ncbi:hypothetical protein ACFWP2_22970 [Kitasatospora sp. NPDC058444]|uniref:hypothetical protein n=1 Tax=Kitasatospora sp. NPDC058444 TaxID=3346504 RepID=UPI0036594310